MFSRITLKYWLPENFYPGKSSEYALGVFGACYKFAVFMNVAVQAFRFAAEPFFFSNANDKYSPVLFATINHYFIIVCCILLFGVSVNLDIFKHLLRDQAYWEGLGIVPILLTAYLFLGVYYNLTVWFKLTDKTYYGTIITIGGALITILMNYFLIPIAGYTGSSWAALICYFSMAAACYMIGQRYYPIPYRIMPALAYIAGTLLIVYGIYQIPVSGPIVSLILKNVLFLVYLIIIYAIERRTLRTSLGL
jgi:O-antigen/teichoic acid export membrane protein